MTARSAATPVVGIYATGPGRVVAELLRQRLAAVTAVRPGGPLDEVATLVHLGLLGVPEGTGAAGRSDPARRRAATVGGTASLLAAARAAQVRRVVAVTSSWVCGPSTPGQLHGDDAAIAVPQESSHLADLVEVERLLERAGVEQTVVLRPAPVVGAGPDTLFAGQFAGARVLAVHGADVNWQFCDVRDLAEAVLLAVLGRVEGRVGVAPPGWLSQQEALTLTGSAAVDLPLPVIRATTNRLARLGLASLAPSDLAALTDSCLTASPRLAGAGWSARFGHGVALVEHLTQLRTAAADAADATGHPRRAATGAGALVAAAGSAALLRAVRRRR